VIPAADRRSLRERHGHVRRVLRHAAVARSARPVRTRRPHPLEHLPRPLALARWLDAARRALAARALLTGLVAVGFGGVAAAAGFARAIQAVVCGDLATGHAMCYSKMRTVIALRTFPLTGPLPEVSVYKRSNDQV